MDLDIPESYDDPQFVKVLDTCLKMEIANAEERYEANMTEIKRLKETIRSELNNRRQLKARMAQMGKVRTILNDTLITLYTDINETSDILETMKANIDDQYKLMQLRSQEYQDLLAEYKETWHAYRSNWKCVINLYKQAVYEEFPLAKTRRAVKINFEKLKIEYMVLTYKKTEMMTIIKQRHHIDWIRIRCKIIEFATVMMEHLKLEKKLMKLEINVDHHRRELQSIEAELQMLRKQKEDQERVRKQKILEMAPPKIKIPYRNMYNQNRIHTRVQSKQSHEIYDDTISINTLVLEELCISENVTALSINADVESMQVDDVEYLAVEMETANVKDNNATSEKTDTHVVVAPITPDIEGNAEKAALIDDDGDVEMKESHREETRKSQESVKAQPCFRTKEKSLKHSAAKNAQEEIQAKRIRLEKENSAKGTSDKISVPQPIVIEEVDLTSPPPLIPKIRKIETVHYNVASIKSMPKYVQRSSVAATTAPSPIQYEYCESNISSVDQDFMSKGPSSLFEGSLCNYRLSPNSNISPACMEDAQMSPVRCPVQQDNTNQSAFQFDNFMGKKEKVKTDFTLF